MLLTLDLGNTFVKSAVFKELTLSETYTFKKDDIFESVSKILIKNNLIKKKNLKTELVMLYLLKTLLLVQKIKFLRNANNKTLK